jgi:hypothetical protein
MGEYWGLSGTSQVSREQSSTLLPAIHGKEQG